MVDETVADIQGIESAYSDDLVDENVNDPIAGDLASSGQSAKTDDSDSTSAIDIIIIILAQTPEIGQGLGHFLSYG